MVNTFPKADTKSKLSHARDSLSNFLFSTFRRENRPIYHPLVTASGSTLPKSAKRGRLARCPQKKQFGKVAKKNGAEGQILLGASL